MTHGCERCGESIDDVNSEAFEMTGELLCELCTDEEFNARAEEFHDEWETERKAMRDLQDMRDAYEPDDPKHPDWLNNRISKSESQS